MSKSNDLEEKLNELFVDKAPKLPVAAQKALVQWSAWISLVVGIVTLFGALSLWHWAHTVNTLANYVNQLCNGSLGNYSCNAASTTTRLSTWIWLTLIVLTLEGVLYLAAFPGLRDRMRQGWNFLYYGALVNLVYAVVSLFNSYGGVGNFIGALIGSAIGFYFLFQIRSSYSTAKASVNTSHTHDS